MVAVAVVRNSFGGPLNELVFSAEQPLQSRLIANLVVHIVTAVLFHKTRKLLYPFVCMFLKTEVLKVNFCDPTMMKF